MLDKTSDVSRKLPRDPAAEYRQPPHNIDAERSLLGTILWKNEAAERVSDFLQPDHFFVPLHAQIYRVILEIISKGLAATPITVKTFFENAEPIDVNTTVSQYLGQIATRMASLHHARDYGCTIYDLWQRRQLILLGEDILNVAYESPVDFPPKEQIEEAEMRLFSLAERGQISSQLVLPRDGVAAALALACGGVSAGLSTGFIDLDDRLGGMRAGELILLAGRTSMGKTALATNIAVNVAKTRVGAGDKARPRAVGFFSQEMAAVEVWLRVLSEQANVPVTHTRRGLEGQAMLSYQAAAALASALPIYFDETGCLSITQLSSRARRMKRKFQLASEARGACPRILERSSVSER